MPECTFAALLLPSRVRTHRDTNEEAPLSRFFGTGATGLEPATSGVTGRRSNQLNYAPQGGVSVAGGEGTPPAQVKRSR